MRCQHYIPHKRRTCRFYANEGTVYCGNHLGLYDSSVAEERATCPFNASHIVWKTLLADHLDKCPTKLQQMTRQAEPWHKPRCNAGMPSASSLPSLDHTLQTCKSATKQALKLVLQLQNIFDQIFQQAEPEQVLLPEECLPCMSPSPDLPFDPKHARQQASIIGHMQHAGLLQDSQHSIYVELGAGKGYLTAMLGSMSTLGGALMLDTGSFRHKADRHLRKTNGLHFQRLRADLRDFYAPGHPLLSQPDQAWVGLGKHLCGQATDFALRCCLAPQACDLASSAPSDSSNKCIKRKSARQHGHVDVASLASTSRQRADCHPAELQVAEGLARSSGGISAANARPLGADGDGQTESSSRCRGLAMAPCCHHRCSWEHYVNQQWMEQLGIGPPEFALLTWMTGWAVCGHAASCKGSGDYTPSSQEAPPAAHSVQQVQETDPQSACKGTLQGPKEPGNLTEPTILLAETGGSKLQQHDDVAGVSVSASTRAALAAAIPRHDRQAIGSYCKRLIDEGRLRWLRQHCWQAWAVKYVSDADTMEPRLIIARPPAAPPTSSS